MATVPVPRTWTAGETVTASIMNATTGVKGALDFMLSPPRCRLYQTATTNMTTSTGTAILFDTELYDTDTMHSTSSNTSRITCNAAGLYFVTGIVGFAASASGYRRADLRKNASGTPFATVSVAATPTLSAAVQVAGYVSLSVGDYVELFGTQSSGGTLATVAGSDWTSFSAIWVANS